MKASLLLSSALLTSILGGCASSSNSSTEPSALSAGDAAGPSALSQPLPGQPTFTTADEAVKALYQASVARDLKGMAHIVGLPEQDVLTGESQKDAALAERFATACDERLKIVPQSDSRDRVFVGNDSYPLASALIRTGNRWFFDSAGGKEELLLRVVGENELAVIGVCRAYVQAQYEYYSEDRNGDDVLQYAQRLASNTGTHDGLYWHSAADETASPLGALIAQARAQGYLSGTARKLDEPRPYHGYFFKILTAQGPDAPGGRYSYILNGRMVAGFALVAYPAKWNHTGIMTFIVGSNGKVYQKDLGETTPQIAAAIDEFNPDASWSLVQD